MVKIIFICLTFSLLSCNKKKHEGAIKFDNNTHVENSELNDSLRNPNCYSYLSDLDTKTLAELILNDSLQPSDNSITFRLMDSLEAKSLEDRKYYFKVFRKIKEKADGALAEAIGLPAQQYVENHTEEFLELVSKFPKEELDSWANTIGIEIMLSSNDNSIEEVNKYFDKVKTNCLNCNEKKKSQLDYFYNSMILAIKENEKLGMTRINVP